MPHETQNMSSLTYLAQTPGVTSGLNNFFNRFLGLMRRGVSRGNFRPAPISGILFLILIGLIFHVLWDIQTDWKGQSARFTFYVAFALIGYFIVFRQEGGDWGTPIIVSLFAWGLPQILLRFVPDFLMLKVLLMLFPIWPSYLLFIHPASRSGLLNVLRVIVLMIWIIGLLVPMLHSQYLDDLGLDDYQSKYSVVDAWNWFWTNLKDNFWKVVNGVRSLPQTWRNFQQQQVAIASGDYYYGEEEEVVEELGVFIEDVQLSQQHFFQDEPIIIWANVRARTLEDNPITIELSCAEDKKNGKIGEVTPKKFKIDSFDEIPIQCKFQKRDFGVGTKSIKIKAKFNFQTDAYIKTYFMDKDRIRSLRSSDIDIFDHYGISETNPVAVFTSGPIEIGMHVKDEQPIGITSKEGFIAPPFAVTLSNSWDGKILNISNLTIQAPKGVKIDTLACKDANEFYAAETAPEGQTIYRLHPKGIAKANRHFPISTFVTFKCPIDISSSNVPVILGSTPIATKYFKSSAQYDYLIEEPVSVEIKKTDIFTVTLRDCTSVCTDSVGCNCPSKCKLEKTSNAKNCGGNKQFVSTKLQNDCPSDILECKDYYDQPYCDRNPCASLNENRGVLSTTNTADLNCYSNFEGRTYKNCDNCAQRTCDDFDNQDQCNFDPCQLSCSWDTPNLRCVHDDQPLSTRFFVWPISAYSVSLCFVNNEIEITGSGDVKAIDQGRVLESSNSTRFGSYIKIQHPDGRGGKFSSTYANLNTKLITAGNVNKGEVIGTSNSKLTLIISTGASQNPFKYFSESDLKKIRITDTSCPDTYLTDCTTKCADVNGCTCLIKCTNDYFYQIIPKDQDCEGAV